MIKAIVSRLKFIIVQATLTVAIYIITKTGLDKRITANIILDCACELENDDFQEEENQEEVSEVETEQVEQPKATWLVTKKYEIMELPNSKNYAMCVKIIDLGTGDAWWLPYKYIKKENSS